MFVGMFVGLPVVGVEVRVSVVGVADVGDDVVRECCSSECSSDCPWWARTRGDEDA